jgi:SAM-dependent methyltransferase
MALVEPPAEVLGRWELISHLWPSEDAPEVPEDLSASAVAALAKRHAAISRPLSQRVAEEKGAWNPSMVYGEVDTPVVWDSLARALDLWRPADSAELVIGRSAAAAPSGTAAKPLGSLEFVDLGCGAGRVLAAAALTGWFSRCVGIEIDGPLVEAATAAIGVCSEAIGSIRCGAADLSVAASIAAAGDTVVEVAHGDLKEFAAWKGANVVFVACTAFDDRLLTHVKKGCEGLAPGSVVITTSHKLASPLLEHCYQVKREVLWGELTVHFHRRLRGGKWLSRVLKT